MDEKSAEEYVKRWKESRKKEKEERNIAGGFFIFLSTATIFEVTGYAYPEIHSITGLIVGGALAGIWAVMITTIMRMK